MENQWCYLTPDGWQPYIEGWNMTWITPTMEPRLRADEVDEPRFVGMFVERQKWQFYGPDPDIDPRYHGQKRPLRTEYRYWPPSTRDQAAERPVAVTTIVSGAGRR